MRRGIVLKKQSIFVKTVACIIILIIICCLPFALQCKHDETMIVTNVLPTCTENGMDNIVCVDCEKILESNEVLATGHSFSEYTLIQKPYKETNGIESKTCSVCGLEESREVVCKHQNTSKEVIKESSCYEEGVEHLLCVECFAVLEENQLPILECSFGEWNITKYATPLDFGERCKTCINCNKFISESYKFSAPSSNFVYIPSSGICHSIYIGDMTQSNIDTHDLVYDTDYFGVKGPWILGHNYGTLGKLPNVKVGQIVYISINGNVKTYVVKYSEFAMQNNTLTDIIGQSSGISVLSNLAGETLHMYTCYGSTKNHRWMVLAELVS